MGLLKNTRNALKRWWYQVDETKQRESGCEYVKIAPCDAGPFNVYSAFIYTPEKRILAGCWEAIDWFNNKGLIKFADGRFALIDKKGRVLGENGESGGKKVYYKKVLENDETMFDDKDTLLLVEENSSKIYRLDKSDGSILSKFVSMQGYSYTLKWPEHTPVYLTDGCAEGKIFLYLEEDTTGGFVLVDCESENVALVGYGEEIGKYGTENDFLTLKDGVGNVGVIISIKGKPAMGFDVDPDYVRKILNDHKAILELPKPFYEHKDILDRYIKVARESARRTLLKEGKGWAAKGRADFKIELEELSVQLEKEIRDAQERKANRSKVEAQRNLELQEIESQIDAFGKAENLTPEQVAKANEKTNDVENKKQRGNASIEDFQFNAGI